MFKPGQYDVNLEYKIENATSDPIQVQLYTQVKRTIQEKGNMVDQTYLGATYGTKEEPYEKYSFDNKIKDLSNNKSWNVKEFFKSDYIVSKDVKAWLCLSEITK